MLSRRSGDPTADLPRAATLLVVLVVLALLAFAELAAAALAAGPACGALCGTRRGRVACLRGATRKHASQQRAICRPMPCRRLPPALVPRTCTSACNNSGLSVSAAMMRGSMPRNIAGPTRGGSRGGGRDARAPAPVAAGSGGGNGIWLVTALAYSLCGPRPPSSPHPPSFSRSWLRRTVSAMSPPGVGSPSGLHSCLRQG